MQLNHDLIREILTTTEQANQPYDPTCLATTTNDHNTIIYHTKIATHAGLINATIHETLDGYQHAIIHDLTPQGHEYLANIKNNTLWKRLKKHIATTTGDASIQTFIHLAQKLIDQTLTKQ